MGIPESRYDILYGMDLDEYCKRQGVSIQGLIKKVEIDIEILKGKFKKEYKGVIPTPLGDEVYTAISKKQKHLERLKEWKQENGGMLSYREVYGNLVAQSLKEASDDETISSEKKLKRANIYAVKNTVKEYKKIYFKFMEYSFAVTGKK